MRAFIAAELSDTLRREIARCQEQFKETGADVKWVAPDNLHLTLKFLGEIDEQQEEKLKAAVAAAVREIPSFEMRIEGIGAFPRTTGPRVVWLGVHQGAEKLVTLAGKVEQACEELGFPKEDRPFSPHLTIGRVRSRNQLAPLVKRLQVAEFRGSEAVPVNRVSLFESVLSPKGPAYTIRAEILLSA